MSKLKEKREQAGLSQSQLAAASGVNKRSIQNYEIGHKDINKAWAILVYRLAKGLDCNVEDLLEIETEE